MTVKLLRSLFRFENLQQGAGLLPSGLLDGLLPPVKDDPAINSLVAVACTPKSTEFVVNPQADFFSNPQLDDVADADLNQAFGQGDGLGDIRALLAYARRKSGTTNTIAAQTVTIRKNDGAGTVLGVFTVATAAASAAPASGLVNQEWISGAVSGVTALHVTVTAADPDVEIVLIALGEN